MAWRDERLKQNVQFDSPVFLIKNPDGSIADLTGATSVLKARYGNQETAVLALLLTESSGVQLGGSSGLAAYAVAPAQALSMTPGSINYDWFITLNSGGPYDGEYDIFSGVWRLSGSVA